MSTVLVFSTRTTSIQRRFLISSRFCSSRWNETEENVRNFDVEPFRKIDSTFTDHDAAFRSKSLGQLWRALMVFQSCGITPFVKNPDNFLAKCQKITGKKGLDWLMRKTFYGHFVAGEGIEELAPYTRHNYEFGVRSILFLSIESDILGHSQDEAKCDFNLDQFKQSVIAAKQSEAGKGTAMIAAKITALARPKFLMHLNAILTSSDGIENATSSHRLLSKLLNDGLYDNEREELTRLLERIDGLCEYGIAHGVKILFDAEQTYFQRAINHFVVSAQAKYNANRMHVLNTYQCYLKETPDILAKDLQFAKDMDFALGCKIVRGAYMVSERERAREMNYPDPICDGFEATTRNYFRAFDLLVNSAIDREKGKVAVIVASHHVPTIQKALTSMQTLKISPSDEVVMFGQSTGQSDHITFPLGQAGFVAHKVVPYGPVNEVLPYLMRRAQENSCVFTPGKVALEKSLLRQEIKDRMLKKK